MLLQKGPMTMPEDTFGHHRHLPTEPPEEWRQMFSSTWKTQGTQHTPIFATASKLQESHEVEMCKHASCSQPGIHVGKCYLGLIKVIHKMRQPGPSRALGISWEAKGGTKPTTARFHKLIMLTACKIGLPRTGTKSNPPRVLVPCLAHN
jgi:hypothetical protein